MSVLHNIVHLAFGVAGLGLAHAMSSARWFLIVSGLIYVALPSSSADHSSRV